MAVGSRFLSGLGLQRYGSELALTRDACELFDELTRTKRGTIVNWSKAWLLPEHFHFVIRRR